MAKFALRSYPNSTTTERLSEDECRRISARAIAHGLIHLPTLPPVNAPRLQPPPGKRPPHEFKTLDPNWSVQSGVPSDVTKPSLPKLQNIMPRAPTSKIIIQTYKDTEKLWRWRFVRRAFGKFLTVADSGESYHNKKDMEAALSHLIVSIQIGNFVRPKH